MTINGGTEDFDSSIADFDFNIGFIADTHWGVHGDQLVSAIDDFIDHMNHVVQPSFCVHLGDIAHGAKDDSTPEDPINHSLMISRLSQCIKYFELEGGSKGNGLDMPIYFIPGNHEYKGAELWDMDEVYEVLVGGGLQDTWRFIDVGDWRVLLLNTFYATKDVDTHPDYRIPDNRDSHDELHWITERIQETTKNIIAVSHQPLTNLVDYVVREFDLHTFPHYPTNGMDVAKLLSEQPNSINIHGHVHHSWAESQIRLNAFGTPQVFINYAINSGDFGYLTLSDQSWKFTPNQVETQSMSTGFPLLYHEMDQRKLRDQYLEYEFNFNSISRNEINNGSNRHSITDSDSGLSLKVDPSKGDRTQWARKLRTLTQRYQHERAQATLKERRLKTTILTEGVSDDIRARIITGTPKGQYFGFEIGDGEIRGVVSDGTSEERVSLFSKVGQSRNVHGLGAYYDAYNLTRENSVKFFIDGRGEEAITSALPEVVGEVDCVFIEMVNPTPREGGEVFVDQIWVKQSQTIG